MLKQPSESPTVARISLGFCAALLLGIFAFVQYQSKSKMDELFEKGLPTNGKITGRVCNNHGKVHYSFSVNAKDYFGIGNCIKPCENAEIGQSVSLIYLPKNPERSSCDSRQDIKSRSQGAYFSMLFIAILASVGIYRITRIEKAN